MDLAPLGPHPSCAGAPRAGCCTAGGVSGQCRAESSPLNGQQGFNCQACAKSVCCKLKFLVQVYLYDKEKPYLFSPVLLWAQHHTRALFVRSLEMCLLSFNSGFILGHFLHVNFSCDVLAKCQGLKNRGVHINEELLKLYCWVPCQELCSTLYFIFLLYKWKYIMPLPSASPSKRAQYARSHLTVFYRGTWFVFYLVLAT